MLSLPLMEDLRQRKRKVSEDLAGLAKKMRTAKAAIVKKATSDARSWVIVGRVRTVTLMLYALAEDSEDSSLRYLLVSCFVLSCLVLPGRVLACPVPSCRVLFCTALSCAVLPCFVLFCLRVSCLAWSRLVLSCSVLSIPAMF